MALDVHYEQNITTFTIESDLFPRLDLNFDQNAFKWPKLTLQDCEDRIKEEWRLPGSYFNFQVSGKKSLAAETLLSELVSSKSTTLKVEIAVKKCEEEPEPNLISLTWKRLIKRSFSSNFRVNTTIDLEASISFKASVAAPIDQIIPVIRLAIRSCLAKNYNIRWEDPRLDGVVVNSDFIGKKLRQLVQHIDRNLEKRSYHVSEHFNFAFFEFEQGGNLQELIMKKDKETLEKFSNQSSRIFSLPAMPVAETAAVFETSKEFGCRSSRDEDSFHDFLLLRRDPSCLRLLKPPPKLILFSMEKSPDAVSRLAQSQIGSIYHDEDNLVEYKLSSIVVENFEKSETIKVLDQWSPCDAKTPLKLYSRSGGVYTESLDVMAPTIRCMIFELEMRNRD